MYFIDDLKWYSCQFIEDYFEPLSRQGIEY